MKHWGGEKKRNKTCIHKNELTKELNLRVGDRNGTEPWRSLKDQRKLAALVSTHYGWKTTDSKQSWVLQCIHSHVTGDENSVVLVMMDTWWCDGWQAAKTLLSFNSDSAEV